MQRQSQKGGQKGKGTRIVLDHRTPRCGNPPDPSESGSWLRARQQQQNLFHLCFAVSKCAELFFPIDAGHVNLNSQVRLMLLTDAAPEVENRRGSRVSLSQWTSMLLIGLHEGHFDEF